MEIVYKMPGQGRRLFLNVVHACPNACFFCVDFKGETFFGFDLKNGSIPSADEIIEAVAAYPNRETITEVYYCGIGEPLLRYDTVMETADRVRSLFSPGTLLAINTSGTYYLRRPDVEFARKFDLIQVSLGAESEEKYNRICRPKVAGAYKAMKQFLWHLHAFLDDSNHSCSVELSVVDTSDIESLPAAAKNTGELPLPDFDACRQIAAEFGWPLKVKSLIKDCEKSEWKDFATLSTAVPSQIPLL